MSALLVESPSIAMSNIGKLENEENSSSSSSTASAAVTEKLNNDENSSSSSSTGAAAAAPVDRAIVVSGERRKIVGSGKRCKIEIKKIKDKNGLFVAFSKRRPGLFKKLNKFVSLSQKGTQAAAVTFSPAMEKVHTFGYPHVEPVFRRFLEEVVGAGAGGSEAKLPLPMAIGSKRKRIEKSDRMSALEESEAAWLKLRREVEMRMTEETVREARTINFFV
ncbi:Agamous-like MADS-box protein AGL62 [Linum grandiflorum]